MPAEIDLCLSEIISEHSGRDAPMSPALLCRSITAMGSALPGLVQRGNLSLEIKGQGSKRWVVALGVGIQAGRDFTDWSLCDRVTHCLIPFRR
jgi:hypothetical protein